jgi:UDP:flavonoid glycosyltransferase YjiC (YdhE family)
MDENELDSAIEYAFRFGEIAIMKGFITAQQLEEALDEQIADDSSNNHHKLIGEILLEQGWMTSKQIAIVLEELIKNKNLRSKAS